jgi:hypothetical protein
VYSLSDYEAAIALLADEAEEIRERSSANEAALRNLRRGTDLGAIVPLIVALRDWAAVAPRRQQDGGDDAQTVEATKTRLQYLFDSLVIDAQSETFVATRAPDVAVLLGQQETSVPCKAWRARPAQRGRKPAAPEEPARVSPPASAGSEDGGDDAPDAGAGGQGDEGGAWVTLSIGGQPRRVYLPPIRPDRDASHIIDLDSGHVVPLGMMVVAGFRTFPTTAAP